LYTGKKVIAPIAITHEFPFPFILARRERERERAEMSSGYCLDKQPISLFGLKLDMT